MAKQIQLIRQQWRAISPHEAEVARRVMFGMVDGLNEDDKRAWRGLWNTLFRMEPGEIVVLHGTMDRSGPFHRRHMSLETKVFNTQEQFSEFGAGFRDWLKVGAGHVEWRAVDGTLTAVPKSTSYDEIEELEMREFHYNAITFLRTEAARQKLWPHLSDRAAKEMIEGVLKEYGE